MKTLHMECFILGNLDIINPIKKEYCKNIICNGNTSLEVVFDIALSNLQDDKSVNIYMLDDIWLIEKILK